ncbi:MAG: flagellar hook protein FlgE [Thermodesulfobacteriota bacterium]
MSLSSLYTGISGLDAYSDAMSVIGNNIANVNTVGFKASRISFEDILSQSMVGATGQMQIGRGVQVASVQRLFAQSTFQTTTSATDLAIDGEGFFIVSKEGATFYTRAGQFYMDQEGRLVNHRGYVLQGWLLDEAGGVTSSLQDVNLSTISSAPRATSEVEMDVNLDVNESVISDPWDVSDPRSTSNYTAPITVYDAMGNGHLVNVYFRKLDNTTWEWHAVLDQGELEGGVQGINQEVASGTLVFTNGRLQTENLGTAFSAQFFGTQSAQIIDMDFGESIDEGGTGLDGTTQFAGGCSTKFLSQDGYTQGNLMSIQVDDDGIVSGLFSNGQSRELYQVALCRFTSPWGLTAMGGNLFAENTPSGPPIIGPPGSSGLGQINSNSLELSNVDLASEFVEMIKTQQAFQANSRVITTTDQMLQELVNLKR